MPQMASVCVGLWVNVGGRHETAAQNGAAHFIEHMLFKGTRDRTARDISEEIEGLGGYLNAFTGEENTCYYAKASSKHLPTLLAVLFDMFLNSRFPPEEIEKEREVILEENAMYLDQPHQLVLEKLNEVLWPKHPLGRPITGTSQSLRRLDRQNLLRFHDQHYKSANILLVGAGHIEHADLIRQAKTFSKRIPTGMRSTFQQVGALADRLRCKMIERRVEQSQLAISFKTCSRHDPRRYALQVLNTILGENMSSRLFQILREERGLAYSVYSNISSFEDAGTLTITAGLDPEKLDIALQLIDRELRRLRDEPPSKDELQRATQYLVGQLDLHLESTENHMIWIGEQLLGFNHIKSVTSIKQKILKVTPAKVQAVANDFFQRNLARIALVGPRTQKAGARRRFLI
ncbi:MAG: putative zinc protease [Verrucomicrobia subdivision 3 bacterium]|nr:putative zinc protease [Limisphaerales bacterium]